MGQTQRRHAYQSLLIIFGFILAAGTISCCTLTTQVGQIGSINTRKPHKSFLYIEVMRTLKKCVGKKCSEVVTVTSGSGFSIANMRGHTIAATAGHVCIDPMGTVESKIRAHAFGGKAYKADIISIVEHTDTCVLGIRGVELPPLQIASEDIEIGEPVIALGAPHGIHHHSMVAKFGGYYSGHAETVVYPFTDNKVSVKLSGFTVPSRPGSSGGPILNSAGAVVGMMILAHPSFETFTLSPRQADIRDVLHAVILATQK